MRIKSLFEHGIRIILRFAQAYAERHVLYVVYIQDHPFLPPHCLGQLLTSGRSRRYAAHTSSAITHGSPYRQDRHHLHMGDRNSDKGFLDALLKEWESGAVNVVGLGELHTEHLANQLTHCRSWNSAYTLVA